MNRNLSEHIAQNLSAEVQNVLLRVPAERIREYFVDSLDQGFEGFSEADKVSLIGLMCDIATYHDMVGD